MKEKMKLPCRVAFVSLGCDKNVVNCEQMAALCRAAGYTVVPEADGADVAVVNTCAFITAAKEEAISRILSAAELKAQGRLKKIIVTGCLSQRYAKEFRSELPEVDGILGTGSFGKITEAVAAVLAGDFYESIGDIHAPIPEYDRILSTPPWYAFLRIAEGCDNRCAYCIIPALRGRYRSRPMEHILAEAERLAAQGVRELIVVAQDVTRYGIDLYGTYRIADLLHELCKLDFHWIRLHYLYPDALDEKLLRAIAEEEKAVPYFDIPIQHCNDGVLAAMNRRGDRSFLTRLFAEIRQTVPNAVLRTSLITGLPGEGEAEFTELCDFLREVKIERAGAFVFSPEEGTPAFRMERVEEDEARRRAECVEEIQSRVMDDFNERRLGTVQEVLCEGFDAEAQRYRGRTYAESPEIDGCIYFDSETEVAAGEFVFVRITGTMDGDLLGERTKEARV